MQQSGSKHQSHEQEQRSESRTSRLTLSGGAANKCYSGAFLWLLTHMSALKVRVPLKRVDDVPLSGCDHCR
jgi:hypothetical protein